MSQQNYYGSYDMSQQSHGQQVSYGQDQQQYDTYYGNDGGWGGYNQQSVEHPQQYGDSVYDPSDPQQAYGGYYQGGNMHHQQGYGHHGQETAALSHQNVYAEQTQQSVQQPMHSQVQSVARGVQPTHPGPYRAQPQAPPQQQHHMHQAIHAQQPHHLPPHGGHVAHPSHVPHGSHNSHGSHSAHGSHGAHVSHGGGHPAPHSQHPHAHGNAVQPPYQHAGRQPSRIPSSSQQAAPPAGYPVANPSGQQQPMYPPAAPTRIPSGRQPTQTTMGMNPTQTYNTAAVQPNGNYASMPPQQVARSGHHVDSTYMQSQAPSRPGPVDPNYPYHGQHPQQHPHPTQPPAAGSARYDMLRKTLSRELMVIARNYRKEVLYYTEKRELNNQDTTQINDSLKKFEKDTAQRFLSAGNEKEYQETMMAKKSFLELRLDYFRQMLDLHHKYLPMLDQYVAKYERTIASGSATTPPEQLARMRKQLHNLQEFAKNIRQPHVIHPSKGLEYIKEVRNSMEALEKHRRSTTNGSANGASSHSQSTYGQYPPHSQQPHGYPPQDSAGATHQMLYPPAGHAPPQPAQAPALQALSREGTGTHSPAHGTAQKVAVAGQKQQPAKVQTAGKKAAAQAQQQQVKVKEEEDRKLALKRAEEERRAKLAADQAARASQKAQADARLKANQPQQAQQNLVPPPKPGKPVKVESETENKKRAADASAESESAKRMRGGLHNPVDTPGSPALEHFSTPQALAISASPEASSPRQAPNDLGPGLAPALRALEPLEPKPFEDAAQACGRVARQFSGWVV